MRSSSIASCALSRSPPTCDRGESPVRGTRRACSSFPPERPRGAGLVWATGWSPASLQRRRLRQQPFGSDLAGALLELGKQATHLVELGPQLRDAPDRGGDERDGPRGVVVQPTDAA